MASCRISRRHFPRGPSFSFSRPELDILRIIKIAVSFYGRLISARTRPTHVRQRSSCAAPRNGQTFTIKGGEIWRYIWHVSYVLKTEPETINPFDAFGTTLKLRLLHKRHFRDTNAALCLPNFLSLPITCIWRIQCTVLTLLLFWYEK